MPSQGADFTPTGFRRQELIDNGLQPAKFSPTEQAYIDQQARRDIVPALDGIVSASGWPSVTEAEKKKLIVSTIDLWYDFYAHKLWYEHERKRGAIK